MITKAAVINQPQEEIKNEENPRIAVTKRNAAVAATQAITTRTCLKKKKASSKYTTKHSTNDIAAHEQLMKQKYGVKLSIRKDVVNKTLFRSLKRHYTELFETQFNIDQKESTASYLEKINEFCQNTFTSGPLADSMSEWNVTLSDIKTLISIMVSPNHVKNVLKDDDLALYKDYYSCIYKYSHKKLAKMLERQVCGYLFTDYIASGKLLTFISSCSTMSQNADTYTQAGHNFYSTIANCTNGKSI
jgi:hypothetical protein